MKHLKLYENFEEEEDSWWDEESPFDNIKYLTLCFYMGSYYLIEEIVDNNVKLFDNHKKWYNIEMFKIRNIIQDDDNIYISDSNNKYNFFDNSGSNWKKFKYKNLPKEIKDRIININ